MGMEMTSIIHSNSLFNKYIHICEYVCTHTPSEIAEVKIQRSQMWQLTPEIPALGKFKHDECQEFKASVGTEWEPVSKTKVKEQLRLNS